MKALPGICAKFLILAVLLSTSPAFTAAYAFDYKNTSYANHTFTEKYDPGKDYFYEVNNYEFDPLMQVASHGRKHVYGSPKDPRFNVSAKQLRNAQQTESDDDTSAAPGPVADLNTRKRSGRAQRRSDRQSSSKEEEDVTSEKGIQSFLDRFK